MQFTFSPVTHNSLLLVSTKSGNPKKIVFIVYKIQVNDSWCSANSVLILGMDILLCHQLYNL
jgi:hypothetical protein